MMLRSSRPTLLHRLHPFTKLTIGCTTSLFSLFLKRPYALAVLALFVVVVLSVLRPRITPKHILSIGLFFGVFGVGVAFVSDTPSAAVTYVLRLAIFLSSMPLFSLTTSPAELSRAISRLPLSPGFVVMVLLVWRFFPLMVEELRRMRRFATLMQPSLGLPRNVYRGILVPFSFFLFEYAERLTLTLELRGFSPSLPRSCAHSPTLSSLDWGGGAITGGLLLLAGTLEWGVWP